MECIILLRTNTGKVVAVEDEDGIAVFANYDEAVDKIESNGHWSSMLQQVVELEEL